MNLFRWFSFLPAVRRRLARRETAALRAAARARTRLTVVNLIREVVPKGTPYQYDAALSFLQPLDPAGFDPDTPVRLTLFFPKLHGQALAVDIFGPEAAEDYREAARFLSPADWEREAALRAEKRAALARYRVPYLVITLHEPIDSQNLRERVRDLIGRYP